MATTARREDPLKDIPEWVAEVWGKEIDAAEKYDEPSEFTVFIGCEWTSMPNGNNPHRNVIF